MICTDTLLSCGAVYGLSACLPRRLAYCNVELKLNKLHDDSRLESYSGSEFSIIARADYVCKKSLGADITMLIDNKYDFDGDERRVLHQVLMVNHARGVRMDYEYDVNGYYNLCREEQGVSLIEIIRGWKFVIINCGARGD